MEKDFELVVGTNPQPKELGLYEDHLNINKNNFEWIDSKDLNRDLDKHRVNIHK